MRDVIVEGIGVISNLGNDVDEIWNNLSQGTDVLFDKSPIKYSSIITPAKKRRMSPYSDMTIYTASKALSDGNVTVEEAGSSSIGTIYTTGYGPMQSNLKFVKSVRAGDPDLCSPTVFANTVANSCVGNTCIQLGLKGVSTILMGSDNWSYSQGLIQKGDAAWILTGSVEEYCDKLIDSLGENESSKNISVKESAVSFLLGKEENSKDCYAHFRESITGDIGGYPLLEQVDETDAYEMIVDMANEMKEKYPIDAVFTSCNGSYFDEIEKKALSDALGNEVTYVHNVKKLIGETLGCAFNINMLIAALCIKHEKLPVSLNKEQKAVRSILVSGYDVSGNYYLGVLEK